MCNEYEIVRVEERIIEGLEIRTENKNGKAAKDISCLWKAFFENDRGRMICGRVNTNYIGLYTDYDGDFTKPYSYLAGCETAGERPAAFKVKKVRAGSYAKFVTKEPEDGIEKIWSAVWTMPLKRRYVSDFEEYFPGEDGQPKEVHIYIGVEK